MSAKELDSRLKALSPAERARLAQKLSARSGPNTALKIPIVDRSSPLPASFAQSRLWFLDQLEPGSATYNYPIVLRLSGVLDVAALESALRELLARHEALRTTFVEKDGEPHQVVHASIDLDITRIDVASEEEAEPLISRATHMPFDLATGPLLRATLLRMRGDAHVLVLCIHHIATDGWSAGILLREMSALYAAFHDGRPSPLSALPCGYADFSVWQRTRLAGDVLDGQVTFWRDHLAGAPAALELPTDRPRPAVKQYRGDMVKLRVPRELASRVQELCRREGVTPFIVLLTAFQTVLSRWSGQDDIVVGTPMANRTHRELEDLVGFFVNTLALRTSFTGDPSFVDVLRQVKRSSFAAQGHQDIPFEKLVDELRVPRDASRTPIFQAKFVLQNAASGALTLGDVAITSKPSLFEISKVDLSLFLSGGADELHGFLQYDIALFDRSTIERFAKHFLVLLDAALRTPEARVATLPLMTDEERLALGAWNARDRPVHGAAVPTLVEAQVDRTPDAI
ncbi:MAG: non-ribosomal peptide synthetase, partial [Deltaproteobacteria bacterium]|nr:non-ribosomal peptide synthetase [Deltaproteobacteria bacterium]